MNAFQDAVEAFKKIHDSPSSGETFKWLLGWHLGRGYVYAERDCFIIGRPVDRRNLVRVESIDDEQESPDCWFIHLAAGSNPFRRFLELMPYELPYLAWERRGKMKIWKTETFRRKVTYGN